MVVGEPPPRVGKRDQAYGYAPDNTRSKKSSTVIAVGKHKKRSGQYPYVLCIFTLFRYTFGNSP